jgi:hypothetical protein
MAVVDLVVIVVVVAAAAFLGGAGVASIRRRWRYRLASRGRLPTKSFLPGTGKSFPYFRRRFCSETEQRFYLALLDAVGEELEVMAKVRAAAVIGCSGANWRAGYGAPIAQKELDFILLQPRSSHVVAAIELDDKTHELAHRRERDAFLNGAFRAAGVPLLRFRPARSYDVEKLREVLLGVAGDRPDSVKRGWG